MTGREKKRERKAHIERLEYLQRVAGRHLEGSGSKAVVEVESVTVE